MAAKIVRWDSEDTRYLRDGAKEADFLVERFIEAAGAQRLESLHPRLVVYARLDKKTPRLHLLCRRIENDWGPISEFNRYSMPTAVEEAERLSRKAAEEDRQEAEIVRGIGLLEKAGFNTTHHAGTNGFEVSGTRWPRAMSVECWWYRYDAHCERIDDGLNFGTGHLVPPLPPETFCRLLVTIRDEFVASLPEREEGT